MIGEEEDFDTWYDALWKRPLPDSVQEFLQKYPGPIGNTFPLKFSISHRAFYIKDADAKVVDTDNWIDSIVSNVIIKRVSDEELWFIIESYGWLRGEIRFLNCSASRINSTEADTVEEAGILSLTGNLELWGCLNEAANASPNFQISVPPGIYRIRITGLNLNSVQGDDHGDDYYILEVWPEPDLQKKVIKRWVDPSFN